MKNENGIRVPFIQRVKEEKGIVWVPLWKKAVAMLRLFFAKHLENLSNGRFCRIHADSECTTTWLYLIPFFYFSLNDSLQQLMLFLQNVVYCVN